MAQGVLVGMSGGVDSSVTALMLLGEGYDVQGATLKLHDMGSCGSGRDAEDARNVCNHLGIAHHVLDFGELFQSRVMTPFATSYAQGKTPNPCILCNGEVKFGRLLRQAEDMGLDKIATGHYARVGYDKGRDRWMLYKAADPTKDQTYVLYMLTQAQLSKTLFPLGGMTKTNIRTIAADAGLTNAEKPDSQDICFVPDGDYGSFLQSEMGVDSPPGDFVDRQGNILGRHNGVIHYTIGQRRGLGIGFGQRMFVTQKQADNRQVTLGLEEDLYATTCRVAGVNWIAIENLKEPMRAQVKARYSQKEVPATLHPLSDGYIQVVFDAPQRALTPGQAAVFYDGEAVLGGGTIEDVCD